MKIKIRNDRDNIIATIEVFSNHVVEETLQGCYESGFFVDDDGEPIYHINIITPDNLVEELSNETLLDEIRSRMRE